MLSTIVQSEAKMFSQNVLLQQERASPHMKRENCSLWTDLFPDIWIAVRGPMVWLASSHDSASAVFFCNDLKKKLLSPFSVTHRSWNEETDKIRRCG